MCQNCSRMHPKRRMLSRSLRCLIVVFIARTQAIYAQPRPDTLLAFDHYVQVTEKQMEQNQHQGKFLVLGQVPHQNIVTQEHKTIENGAEITVPHGLVQHWLGAMFIPKAKLTEVKSVMQNYNEYQRIYKPDVIASRLIRQDGDNFDIFLRLYKKQIFTVVYNTTYRVNYSAPDAKHLLIRSHATRISEVQDSAHPDAGEKAPGEDHGFLYRLEAYWRFEEADGGVYVECEAVSLSRDVPALVQTAFNRFIQRFPIESMRNTLAFTRTAVLQRTQLASANE